MHAEITLHVDGETQTAALDTRTTLLDALRDHLGVMAPKKGCDHGQCGSCTVLLDGRRVVSCLAFAVAHNGAVVTTAAGLADDGLRVIAVAEGHDIGVPEDALHAEDELTFVGLAAFRDPLRAGVRDAVAMLAHAGVRTIVVSGDHPATVAATAREAGVGAGEAGILHGGAALDALDDDELAEWLRGEAVIARAT